MQLPGRLKSTSLGDLLGTLHRAESTGALELIEPQGRVHRVYLARGRVSAVELDRASASLAELLRRAESVDEDTLRRSLLRAMASRRLHGEVLAVALGADRRGWVQPVAAGLAAPEPQLALGAAGPEGLGLRREPGQEAEGLVAHGANRRTTPGRGTPTP